MGECDASDSRLVSLENASLYVLRYLVRVRVSKTRRVENTTATAHTLSVSGRNRLASAACDAATPKASVGESEDGGQ
jgi:hypothetical protein